MALVNGPGSFYLMRFLLGVAEAGAYPGICYYLTAWYSEAQYGVAYSYIPTGSAFSGVIGGALAAVILQLDGVAGLPGWRWLFVVEGIIPVALGLALPRLRPQRHGSQLIRPITRAMHDCVVPPLAPVAV